MRRIEEKRNIGCLGRLYVSAPQLTCTSEIRTEGQIKAGKSCLAKPGRQKTAKDEGAWALRLAFLVGAIAHVLAAPWRMLRGTWRSTSAISDRNLD